MTTTNQIYTWDCTVGTEHYTIDQIKEWCKENCKKWVFQIERGEKTGFMHYQIRCSTKSKVRSMTKHLKPGHWTPTSNENKDNDFYITKTETRVEGPWSDKDKDIYIPKQVREIENNLRPWQLAARDMTKIWNTRSINIIYDKTGNIGKSVWSLYMEVYGLATIIPYVNNYKDVMRMVCDMGVSPAYIIDIPRSIKKRNMREIFAAIETIKGGYAYDDRYSMRKIYFDSPCIWVFTNKLVKPSYLSEDRWSYFTVTPKMELRPYTPTLEDYPKKKKSGNFFSQPRA